MEHSISKTNINNSSRRPKSNSLDLVDRISTLPDSILGIILSFIPTKNAVATAVLSKRWKFIWTTVHNLDFCHEGRWGKVDEGENMRFVQFVNRVLLHHDAGLLHKFRLAWTWCISSDASSWISTAIMKNVHELILCVKTRFKLFEVPICVLSCVSLQSLELSGSIFIPAANEVCLPRLESLKLVSVCHSEEAFKELLRGCPVLNYLHIHEPYHRLRHYGEGEDDFTYILSSTSLRRLEICFEYERPEVCYQYEPEIGDTYYYYGLQLEASSLEYIKLVGYIPVPFVQKSLSSLVEADFRVYLHELDLAKADICNSIVEIVRVFTSAKTLTLSAEVMWALSCATINLSTEFKRLVKLESGTYCCDCSSLWHFIQSSENLEVVAIYQRPNSLDERDHDHSGWTDPVEVPRCLSSSLKKVVLKGYYGNEDEREMIRYILKHGSALEVMQISCDRNRNNAKFKLVQEICQFPRKSPTCEVKFFRWTSKSDAKVLLQPPMCCRVLSHHGIPWTS